MEDLEALCKKLSFLSTKNQLKWNGTKNDDILRFLALHLEVQPNQFRANDNGTCAVFKIQSYTVEPLSPPPPSNIVTSRTLSFLNRTFQYIESKLTSLFPPPQLRFSNLPIIWTNFVFSMYEVQNERDSIRSNLTFRLKVLHQG